MAFSLLKQVRRKGCCTLRTINMKITITITVSVSMPTHNIALFTISACCSIVASHFTCSSSLKQDRFWLAANVFLTILFLCIMVMVMVSRGVDFAILFHLEQFWKLYIYSYIHCPWREQALNWSSFIVYHFSKTKISLGPYLFYFS